MSRKIEIIPPKEVKKAKLQLLTHREAFIYLGISEEKFLKATNVEAKLSYKLLLGERFYTKEELDKYREEEL